MPFFKRMAPAAAAAANNWISCAFSPMETPQILPTPLPSSDHYFLDSFYSNDWGNPKVQGMYTDYVVEQPMENPVTVPKLEDFLGGDNTASYNSQNEESTQDSSSQLSHLYEYDPHHHHTATNYFAVNHHQQDLKAVFSANSGSEVDDSDSAVATQLGCGGAEFMGQSIESSQTEFVGGSGDNLSLTVVSQSSQKAIVTSDSDNVKKIADTFGQRTSLYRGVTRHRWTGRYEAHLWDNSCRREGQARKGRQVYLGGYDKEEKAVRAYDLAALKYWGPNATTNFPIPNYSKEFEEMKHVTKQEFIASLRRKSSGFSRGASIYRGVTSNGGGSSGGVRHSSHQVQGCECSDQF